MQRTTLGQSPLEISRIVFGPARFRSSENSDRSRLLHAAVDAGMTSLPSAPLYDFGEVEALSLRAIRDRREHVEILGKVGLRGRVVRTRGLD